MKNIEYLEFGGIHHQIRLDRPLRFVVQIEYDELQLIYSAMCRALESQPNEELADLKETVRERFSRFLPKDMRFHYSDQIRSPQHQEG